MLLFYISSASQLDLGPVCQAMWDTTKDNLKVPLELKFNDQQTEMFELTVAGKARIDSSDVFQTFKALLTNPQNTVLQDTFFDAIMAADRPVGQAYDYLMKTNPVLPPTTTMARFECMLRDMWFARKGKGFLHVFVGEENKLWFSGLHNWYQFYLEQSKMTIEKNFKFSYNTEPNFIEDLKFKLTSSGLKKYEPTSMFVGTSPEFDFALFSVCFLALYKGQRDEKECTCNIRNSEIRLRVLMDNRDNGWVFNAYPFSVKALTCIRVPPKSRTGCGESGIERNTCGKRGCCFDNKNYGSWTYWCFYPSDHKCHVYPPKNRKICGNPGINRDDCEGKGCCFEEKFDKGVCFEGVPK